MDTPTTKLTKEHFTVGIKMIRRYLMRNKPTVMALGAMGILLALLSASLPFISGKLIDTLTNADIQAFWMVLIIFGGVSFLNNSLGVYYTYKERSVGTTIFSQFQTDTLHHIIRLPVYYHHDNNLGGITESTNRTASALDNIVSTVVVKLAPEFLSIIVAFVFMFSMSPRLSVVMLIGIVLFSVIIAVRIGPGADLQKQMREAWKHAFNKSYDVVGNIVTVKQASREFVEEINIARDFETARQSNIRIIRFWNTLGFFQRSTILATVIMVWILGALMVIDQALTIGQLLAFIGYTAMVFGPFLIMGNMWRTIQNGLIYMEESQKIMDMVPEIYVPENAVSLDSIQGDIVLDHVHFAYEHNQDDVLHDVTLRIAPGSKVALVGESGSGKSTLMDLLFGFAFPQEGSITIDGYDIRQLDLNHYRKQIAVVPQEPVLFNLSIRENVVYGSENISEDQLLTAARQAHILEFVEAFPDGWNQLVGNRGVKLSGGQKQRVAIARAILQQPDILILDEPTSALDARSEDIISTSLKSLMENRTVIVAAHRLSTVRDADQIFVFDKGRIVEQGTHNELSQKNGIYQEMLKLQTELH